jgi:phosphotransferase system enzyme I (PtsI)
MLPMVSTVEDISMSRKLIKQVSEKCRKKPLELGVMIETPSSALIANQLASQVDFFSIGTNDLTQYTLAADRGNIELKNYQDPLHPSVLKLIQNVISAGLDNDIDVSVCGEMASDGIAAIVLYSLGMRIFSLSPNSAAFIFHSLINAKFLENKESINIDDFTSAEEVRRYVIEKN